MHCFKCVIFFYHNIENFITKISPNFLMWKFCGKAQVPYRFGWIARNSAKLCLPTIFHTSKLGEIYAVKNIKILQVFNTPGELSLQSFIFLDDKKLKTFGDIITQRGFLSTQCNCWANCHCVKRIQVQSFFWCLFSCIWAEYRKIWTWKNSVFWHFSRCVSLVNSFGYSPPTNFRWDN